MKYFKLEFETLVSNEKVTPLNQAAHLAIKDLPFLIEQNIGLALTPCKCGILTKFKISIKNNKPNVMPEWCCSDFQNRASKLVPYIQ